MFVIVFGGVCVVIGGGGGDGVGVVCVKFSCVFLCTATIIHSPTFSP